MKNTHALQLSCAPIPIVRIGFIGLGQRGMVTLRRYLMIEGVDIVALCDVNTTHLAEAHQLLAIDGRYNPSVYDSASGWREMCGRDDVDLVYICTDWLTHTPMACYAMEHGKHVAVEVPAATTVDECWQLVDTAERTQRHCFMLENCCYDTFHQGVLVMERKGLFGEVTHAEGAYIHDLRDKDETRQSKGWMSHLCRQHKGNPYPTHGVGPVCQLLHIHRGDRLDYLVSLTPSSDFLHNDVCVNNTLIKTVKGKSILLQYDVTTPRPYSRMQTLCGTKGFAQKYPRSCIVLDGEAPMMDDEADTYISQYTEKQISEIQKIGFSLEVPNIMNYTMDYRLVYCLRNGLPLDIDVYDAAEWSCIAELSEQSALQGGLPVKIPDFTRGRWKV
jgi:predicted dehydrogenase